MPQLPPPQPPAGPPLAQGITGPGLKGKAWDLGLAGRLIKRSVLAEPHLGQAGEELSPPETNSSNSSPHLLQTKSNMGMESAPSGKFDVGNLAHIRPLRKRTGAT